MMKVKHYASRRFNRSGMTMIELLVVIAVIGLLIAISIPAIQKVREAARRTQCRNNLKQIGVAMHNHEALHRRFPSNGWGYLWIGVPGRGSDERQPGGWIYNLLPYIEQTQLAELGYGETGPAQRAALTQLTQTPLTLFKCPSRPGSQVSAANPIIVPRNADWLPEVAKTDYACNEGDFITDTRGGPLTLEEGDSDQYQWRDTRQATGVCFQRSEIGTEHITDGMSQTYLVGEKSVSTNTAEIDPGHDQSMYSGVDLDLNRWVLHIPLQDDDGIHERRFGSAHAGGCHFLFCDGAVKFISYNIDVEIHRRLGNREDGLTVDAF